MSVMGNKVRMYLDASIIVRLSLSNSLGKRLLRLKSVDTGLDIVSSIYTIQETLGVISENGWPPKATLAVIVFLGYVIKERLIQVRLELPIYEAMSIYLGMCRDKADLPVLWDAWIEGCNVIVTGDRDFLDDQDKIKDRTGIQCMGLEHFLSQYESHPEVAAALDPSGGHRHRHEH